MLRAHTVTEISMHFAYSALITLLLPLFVLRMLWRSRRAPAYRQRLGERLGYFAAPLNETAADARPVVWIHAVSLGETLAARPLIDRLLTQMPRYRIAVTTTTPTGSEQLRKLFGDRVFHVYAPWDTPGCVQRFLQRLQPQMLIIMETELWPNLLRYSQRANCKVLLANARLSARSAAGYARFATLSGQMLAAVDWIAAQSDADAERFVGLGTDPARIAVSGSIKYDLVLDTAVRARAAELRQIWRLAGRPTVLVASTHDDEERMALEAFASLRKVQPKALLMLAPRHPERFTEVAQLCETQGWSLLRRSTGAPPTPGTDVLLVDTLGELIQLFGVADIAVIGGSFIARGGHNPLEAAAWGRPILCGESMFNFTDITRQLRQARALEQVGDSQALGETLIALCADEPRRQRMGAAARAVMDANRGALDKLLQAVRRLLAAH